MCDGRFLIGAFQIRFAQHPMCCQTVGVLRQNMVGGSNGQAIVATIHSFLRTLNQIYNFHERPPCGLSQRDCRDQSDHPQNVTTKPDWLASFTFSHHRNWGRGLSIRVLAKCTQVPTANRSDNGRFRLAGRVPPPVWRPLRAGRRVVWIALPVLPGVRLVATSRASQRRRLPTGPG